MRVLVVGSGAREHALVWKLKQSPRVEAVFAAPGNAGTAEVANNLPLGTSDLHALAAAADRYAIDLTVVGPEDPLARGITDIFTERGLVVAGPTAAGARIESSKVWAKEVMQAAGVPTGHAEWFTDLDAALDAVASVPLPVVVKADGLAGGKGVTIAQTRSEAEVAVRALLEQGSLGEAGQEILIEEYLTGQEVSVLALTDGETIHPLVPACDYKRIGEGDTGANTGGMGAYAPVPAVDTALSERIVREILQPTVTEMRQRGIIYRGVLYAGLILTPAGPKVLEFNCRFGDPEAEVVLPLLRGDLAELLDAAAMGHLGTVAPPEWESGTCVGVVLASGGYPASYEIGYPISGLSDLPPQVIAFHAGTATDSDGQTRTRGGRVITLVARGEDFAHAREHVYAGASRVSFERAYYRHDIAVREVTAV